MGTMMTNRSLTSNMDIKSPIGQRIRQPTQNKKPRRKHIRSLSQQSAFAQTPAQTLNNDQVEVQEGEPNQANSHKRSHSKDNLKRFKNQLNNPLVSQSVLNFNKRFKRMHTALDTIEDKDERSSSICTSQANGLRGAKKDSKLSRDF